MREKCVCSKCGATIETVDGWCARCSRSYPTLIGRQAPPTLSPGRRLRFPARDSMLSVITACWACFQCWFTVIAGAQKYDSGDEVVYALTLLSLLLLVGLNCYIFRHSRSRVRAVARLSNSLALASLLSLGCILHDRERWVSHRGPDPHAEMPLFAIWEGERNYQLRFGHLCTIKELLRSGCMPDYFGKMLRYVWHEDTHHFYEEDDREKCTFEVRLTPPEGPVDCQASIPCAPYVPGGPVVLAVNSEGYAVLCVDRGNILENTVHPNFFDSLSRCLPGSLGNCLPARGNEWRLGGDMKSFMAHEDFRVAGPSPG